MWFIKIRIVYPNQDFLRIVRSTFLKAMLPVGLVLRAREDLGQLTGCVREVESCGSVVLVLFSEKYVI